jgi:hypothetical protein
MAALKQEHCKNGHLMSQYRKQHPNGDTYCSACKVERTKKARKLNPEKTANYGWKSKIKAAYSISEEEYFNMYSSQEGKCAICSLEILAKNRSTHIDHNHTTGKVRGLLCHHCNTALGLFKENTKTLEAAMQYLNNDGFVKAKK